MDSRKENPEGQPVKQVYVVEHFVRGNFGDGFSFRHAWIGHCYWIHVDWATILFLSFIRWRQLLFQKRTSLDITKEKEKEG
jgi:hypothetical protein